MARAQSFLILLGTAGALVLAALVRHRAIESGQRVPGGMLIRNPACYDALTHRFLLGSLFRPVAADIAAAVPAAARLLEVGCGPGHLSIRLAREHGLDVTGLDLDPAMIERARTNAERATDGLWHMPTFVVGNVASLPFPDASFDAVVSTLSMHHWADPTAGLAEIGRVLRPGGRALIWDFRRGFVPFHGHAADPDVHARGSVLRLAEATPWPWPWKFRLLQRLEFVPIESSPGGAR